MFHIYRLITVVQWSLTHLSHQFLVPGSGSLGSVPDFILKDAGREVQLEVSKNCIPILFDCFDNNMVAWQNQDRG